MSQILNRRGHGSLHRGHRVSAISVRMFSELSVVCFFEIGVKKRLSPHL